MFLVFLKSTILAVFAVVLMIIAQSVFHTRDYLSDIGGISAFLVAFGSLYGIIAAFIVVEVWGKFNNTKYLIEQEAEGLEKLYLLSSYFRDKKFTEHMYTKISDYIKLIIQNNFKHLRHGKKQGNEDEAFAQLAQNINHLKINSDADGTVFGLIVEHYTNLSQVRTERLHKSVLRLPIPLRLFFYTSSFFMVVTFIFMPFINIYYDALMTGSFVFSLSLLLYIIEDLDNPFFGDMWHITPDTFRETLDHIDQTSTTIAQ